MSIEEQMAHVAGAVWSLNGWAAGWVLGHKMRQNGLEGDWDALGIYQQGNQCAVAFQGTNDNLDHIKNFDVAKTSGCGFDGLHRGFYSTMQKFVSDSTWTRTIKPFLKSNCAGGVHVTGHSLGGAIAAVFSACANSASNPFGFRVNFLWNYAGPGVSQSPLTNGQSSNGCFEGARFWNEDNNFVDPVAGAAGAVGFVHERIKVVQLNGSCHVYSCNEASTKLPGFNPLFLTRYETHDINKYYIPRVAAFFTHGRCAGGGDDTMIPGVSIPG